MKSKLLAKSSSGEPYNVEFAVEGDCIRVFCHCPAGVTQQMCKHKLALCIGDTNMLFDSSHASLLVEIQAWPQFARLQSRVTRYAQEMGEIETAKAEVTKREKVLKGQMAKDLARGGY